MNQKRSEHGGRQRPSTALAASRAAATVVVVVAASVLLGWLLGIETLKRLVPGAVSMNPMTAIAMMLAGISLYAAAGQTDRSRYWIRGLALAVLTIGLSKLAHYITGFDSGVDRLLFPSLLDADLGKMPNRIAPNTALNFVLIGTALLTVTWSSPRLMVLGRTLAIVSAFLSIIAVAGYINGVTSLYGVLSYIPMAVHTAACFALLSIGVICILFTKLRARDSDIASYATVLGTPIQRKVFIGFGAALFLLCVIGIVSIQSTRQLIGDFQANEREQRTVYVLEDILSKVTDAETGVRGFIISGDQAYLEPYKSAVSNIEHSLQELRGLAAGTADRASQVDRLESLVRAKLDVSARGIAFKRDQGFDAARELLVGGEGKYLMDELRHQVAQMQAVEQALLRDRAAMQATNAQATITIIAIGSTAAIVLVVVAIFMIRRDIIARANAERALQDSETKFRQLAQHIDEVFWVSSGDRIVYASPAFETIWGRSCQWVCDNPMAWLETIVPEDREGVSSAFLAAATGEADFDVRYRIVRTDGQQRWIHARGVPVRNEAGQVYRVVGVAADITREKQAEEDLVRARHAADAANRMKSEFLANMSHEIRTPMSAIIGYVDLLLDRNQTPSDRFDSINAIRTNSDHLLTIINDILDLSKIEAGEMQVEQIPCCPCQIVSEVASTTRVRAAEKKLVFEVVTTGQVPCMIQSDPTRLKQILINLIGNAIKFTKQGHVSLLMQMHEASGDEKPKLRFQVVDSGIGMTTEQIGRLFKPFSQADSSTTRQFGGTGLGLTISRQLARMLGGDITVESEIGRGSIFSLTIDPGALSGVRMLRDCSEAVAQLDPKASEDAPTVMTGRVLLADDGPHNQHVLSIYLRQAGLEITTADNGRIACALTFAAMEDGRPFDLILMDMQMPELDGYAATARLRQKGYTGPIVALTAHAMAGDRQKCINAGCTDYLSKPVSKDNLLQMVASYLKSPAPLLIAQAPSMAATDDDDQRPTLRSSGVEPVLKPFLDRFVSELPDQVELIVRLAREQNLESLRRVIHGLRGIGGLYGFMPISDLAGEAEERILGKASLEEIALSVDDLIRLLTRVEGYLPPVDIDVESMIRHQDMHPDVPNLRTNNA